MKQCKLVILTLLLLSSSYLFAQDAAVATGGDASGSGGTASYSVGQVVYTTATGGNGSSSQGVQQAYDIVTGINKTETVHLEMQVFPNPTTTSLNLKVGKQDVDQLFFELYNAAGQLILMEQINNTLTVVPMQKLASGTYFLKVQTDKEVVKTFSIIKNR
ncbi:MAG: T9SS type A sorting domain-containing protein [Aureispira sp.]|nr:T9SS type A sorting domain-containing protein [Aureispira sp.]